MSWFLKKEGMVEHIGAKLDFEEVVIFAPKCCHAKIANEGVQYMWAWSKGARCYLALKEKKGKEDISSGVVRHCLSARVISMKHSPNQKFARNVLTMLLTVVKSALKLNKNAPSMVVFFDWRSCLGNSRHIWHLCVWWTSISYALSVAVTTRTERTTDLSAIWVIFRDLNTRRGGWHVCGDAVVNNFAERLGLQEGDILYAKDGKSGDAFVQLAFGETQIIEENPWYSWWIVICW